MKTEKGRTFNYVKTYCIKIIINKEKGRPFTAETHCFVVTIIIMNKENGRPLR